jgi:hypothetical protein
MAADEAVPQGPANSKFGTCCNELKQAMSGEEFEPLITVGDDGILYMSVGLIDMEDDEPGMVDHPVFFCPFCGTRVQTVENVQGSSNATDASSS